MTNKRREVQEHNLAGGSNTFSRL